MTTTRNLRQLKAQMRATTRQVDQVIAALRPPTGSPVALAAPAGYDRTDRSDA